MYLHQGKHKLIEGTVASAPANEARLVLRTQVTLPPRTIGIVPVKATEPNLLNLTSTIKVNLTHTLKHSTLMLQLYHCCIKQLAKRR